MVVQNEDLIRVVTIPSCEKPLQLSASRSRRNPAESAIHKAWN